MQSTASSDLMRRAGDSVRLPVRAGAKKTYESILLAAQQILAAAGIEALNSNAIAERAGVSPPVFYHYFKNKHALLLVLAIRLIEVQDEILARLAYAPQSDPQQVGKTCLQILQETHEATEKIEGAQALLVALRAIPEIADVRVDANHRAAKLVAEHLQGIRPELTKDDAYERTRLGVEFGYSAIELLLESPELSSQRVLKTTADAIVGIYFA